MPAVPRRSPKIGVSTRPGAITFIVTPVEANSAAIEPSSKRALRSAMALVGGCYTGIRRTPAVRWHFGDQGEKISFVSRT